MLSELATSVGYFTLIIFGILLCFSVYDFITEAAEFAKYKTSSSHRLFLFEKLQKQLISDGILESEAIRKKRVKTESHNQYYGSKV